MATSDAPLHVPNVTLAVARGASGGFLLPMDNTVDPIRAMMPIYPLDDNHADASSNSSAYYKNARPGQLYSCPIVVAYGRYPFKCTIKSAPPWLSVGEFLAPDGDTLTEDADYMTVSGTPPLGSEGEYTVTVEIRDQDYRGISPSQALTISWTLTVGTANWYFVAPVATGAGDGSSPDDCAVPDWSAWSTSQVAAGQGKICVYREGAYEITTNTDFQAEYHPITHMAYPGESVVISTNGNQIEYKTDDFLMVGLTLVDGVSRYVTSTRRHDRQGLWRCKLDGLQVDTEVIAERASNQAAWYLNRPVGMRKYAFLRECTFSNYNDVTFYDWYSISNSIAERNTVLDAQGNETDSNVYFPKNQVDYHSVRRNVAVIPNTLLTARQFYHMYFADTNGLGSGTDADVSYNVLVLNPGSAGSGEAWFESTTADTTTAHSRRNTQVGVSFTIADFTSGTVKVDVESNVIQHSGTGGSIHYYSAVEGVNSTVSNDELHVASGAADTNTGKLSGPARTTWLGKRGFEIAGAVQ